MRRTCTPANWFAVVQVTLTCRVALMFFSPVGGSTAND